MVQLQFPERESVAVQCSSWCCSEVHHDRPDQKLHLGAGSPGFGEGTDCSRGSEVFVGDFAAGGC